MFGNHWLTLGFFCEICNVAKSLLLFFESSHILVIKKACFQLLSSSIITGAAAVECLRRDTSVFLL